MTRKKWALLGMGAIVAGSLVTVGLHARAADGVSDETPNADAPAASDTITVTTVVNLDPPLGPSSGSTRYTGSPITCTFASDPGETDVSEAGMCGSWSMSGTLSGGIGPGIAANGTGTINVTGPETNMTIGFSAVFTPTLITLTGSVTGGSALDDADVGGTVAGSLTCTVSSPGPTPGSIAQLTCAGSIAITEGPWS